METLVIKVWTESVVNEQWTFDMKRLKIRNMIADIISLRKAGIWIALVSSWAFWLGQTYLEQKPKWYSDTIYKQVCAWIWQVDLMMNYKSAFNSMWIPVFQLLCTHNDFHDERRASTIKSDLNLCFDSWILPIINENDPLTNEEMNLVWKKADNDNLSLHVARLIKACALMIITNVNWVYNMDPSNSMAHRFPLIANVNPSIATSSKSEKWTWWMLSKLKVAKIAQNEWIDVHILDWETSTISDHYFWMQNWWTFIPGKK